MSQRDLDELQIQLKSAIQNHQKLVSRIQLQPQDTTLKVQLHNLQKEIMTMSQKQKIAVQKLRKDLLQTHCRESDKKQHGSKDESEITEAVKDGPCKGSTSVSGVTVSPLRVPNYPSAHTTDTPTTDRIGANQARDTTVARTPEKHATKQQESCEKARELKKKLDFMACIDLVPPDSIKDTPGKRSERKRKSTNNPNFAYGFELERRPKLSNFIASDYFGAKKTKSKPTAPAVKSNSPSPVHSRPSTPAGSDRANNGASDISKENMPSLCCICDKGGEVCSCHICRNVYHLSCVSPSLNTPPSGHWSCPKCQESGCRNTALSLSAVSSYISYKTGKEEERRKLVKRGSELLQEKTHLENRSKQLNEILGKQGIRKQELIEINLKAKQSVENLKNFVRAVQSS